ncbi:hypothetical protein ACFOKJ_14665 [Vogesella amnigena]|uniref:Solute-binding protein family 3/N-terminal domain-containing protein n=1 Tax=Vogesella amnigena TaxID=1507449 RepID=A0ABV7TX73_9NEIS
MLPVRLLLTTCLWLPVAALACNYTYPVAPNQPALYQQAASGEESGLMVVVAQRLATLSGCRLQPQQLPLARRDAVFRSGQLMLQLGVLEDPQIPAADAEFVPMLRMALRVGVLRGGAYSTADEALADISTRLGMIRGTHLAPTVTTRLNALSVFSRIEYSNDRSSLYQKLARQRLSAVLDTTSWAPTGVSGLEGQLQRLPFRPPLYVRVGSYLSTRLPATDRQHLRRALQQLVAEDALRPLIQTYLAIPASDLLLP